MKEVCIPFADIRENERAEVEVRVPKSKRVWKYRVESFDVASGKEKDEKEKMIENLRYRIKTYDSDWELIQIFESDPESGYVQLLYRQKK